MSRKTPPEVTVVDPGSVAEPLDGPVSVVDATTTDAGDLEELPAEELLELPEGWNEGDVITSMTTPVPVAGQGVTIPLPPPESAYEPGRDAVLARDIAVVIGWRIEGAVFEEGDAPEEPQLELLLNAGVPFDRARLAIVTARGMGYHFVA